MYFVTVSSAPLHWFSHGAKFWCFESGCYRQKLQNMYLYFYHNEELILMVLGFDETNLGQHHFFAMAVVTAILPALSEISMV